MQKSDPGTWYLPDQESQTQGDKASLEAKSDKKGVPGKKLVVVKEEECWC